MSFGWSIAAGIAVVSLGVGDVLADDFDDFRIPRVRRMDWSATLQAWGERSSDGTPYVESHQRNAQGTTASQLSWLSDSDPCRTSLVLQAEASGFGD